ncbi:unnamed protein product [Diabrotica balteata]|uniref:Endonuclease-reverse transcriptase n=1 Tax=Diabrotica balteata TaxID=107213 RepID=A0A9N9SSS4_DIABA|nr:unnamed protein product [Diabrotica balteata]
MAKKTKQTALSPEHPLSGKRVLRIPRSANNVPKVKRIGTWNIRSMYQAGKAGNTIQEMTRLNIDILGCSEVRWPNSGIRILNEHYIYYSGDDTTSHRNDIAIIVKREIAKAVYAPTSESIEEEIENFYQTLEHSLKLSKKHELTIIMGDFYAKIGQGTVENVVGSYYGIGIRNERGERLIQFCQETDMVGQILTTVEDKLRRWKEYVQELFDDAARSPTDINNPYGPELTKEEVTIAIKQIKDGKSTGPDKVHGKCEEHRLISLMSHILKVLLTIIHLRIYTKLEEHLAEVQCGFRAGLETRKALFSFLITANTTPSGLFYLRSEIFPFHDLLNHKTDKNNNSLVLKNNNNSATKDNLLAAVVSSPNREIARQNCQNVVTSSSVKQNNKKCRERTKVPKRRTRTIERASSSSSEGDRGVRKEFAISKISSELTGEFADQGSKLLMAFADDIDAVTHSTRDVREKRARGKNSATWTFNQWEINKLLIFERKVLRIIVGPQRDEFTGDWRRWRNAELVTLYGTENIVKNIKANRIR